MQGCTIGLPKHVILEWISWADDVFEVRRPEVDLVGIMQELLRLAMTHDDSEVRLEALEELSDGLVNHSKVPIDLKPLAESLSSKEGKELLVALNAVAFSHDRRLASYVMPFVESENSYVRNEAIVALYELRVWDVERNVQGPPKVGHA